MIHITQKIHWIYLCLILMFFSVFLSSAHAHAFVIEDVDVEITNDFVLKPGKIEVFVNPGDTVVRNITVTNRTNKTISFMVGVEDFVGTHERDNTVVLLGNDVSPYSLKNFMTPELDAFTLNEGQQITLPVSIFIPANIIPSGMYGAIIISNTTEAGGENTSSKTRLISRLGSLFFVKVNGERIENGALQDFRIIGPTHKIYNNGRFEFEILFRNDGNAHLVPYGVIEIRNMFGSVIETLSVDPYFALPDTTRFRKISWNGNNLFGQYTVTLKLNRGYGDIVDEKHISLFVYPWKVATTILFVFAGVFVLTRFVKRRFEIRRKQ